MNRLFVHIHPLFLGSPSHLDQHRALGGVPGAVQYYTVPVSHPFLHGRAYTSNPISHFIWPQLSLLGSEKFKFKRLINKVGERETRGTWYDRLPREGEIRKGPPWDPPRNKSPSTGLVSCLLWSFSIPDLPHSQKSRLKQLLVRTIESQTL